MPVHFSMRPSDLSCSGLEAGYEVVRSVYLRLGLQIVFLDGSVVGDEAVVEQIW